MPAKLIGHPDFIQYGSSPIPTLIAQLGPFGSGTNTPPNLNMTSGGSYILAIYSDSPNHSIMVDVSVSHLDANGTVIMQEQYGRIPYGGFSTEPVSINEPVLLRGNIYGTQLQLTFASDTAANMNTLLNVAGITLANVLCNVYIVPSSLADPDPKVSSSAIQDAVASGNFPQGLLYTLNGVAVAFGTTNGPKIIAPYSGPAKLVIRQTGVSTTPNNVLVGIRSYTVANGVTAISNMQFSTPAASQSFEYDLCLPTALCLCNVQNLDGAQNANVTMSIMAERSA